MAEHASEEIVVQADPDACWAVLLDVESYPSWVPDLKSVGVLERDGEGRGLVVEFRAAGFGRSTTYSLRYDHDEPRRLGWQLEQGDVERAIDGAYILQPVDGGTKITYELSIDLKVPMPGFVKRRAEERIIRAALPQLKARVEATVD